MGKRRQLALAGECSARAPCTLKQTECDRRLVRELREELHLGEREWRVLPSLEHLEDTERTLVVQERNRHQPFRHEAGALGHLPSEAWIVGHVLDDERLL